MFRNSKKNKFFFIVPWEKTMGVDEILEARFRHILEQDQWIPKVSATPKPASVTTPPTLMAGGGCDDPKKWLGCLLVSAAAVGLLAIWCRR